MYAVSKCAPQEALRNLDNAFVHFFRRVKLKKTGAFRGPVGYPRFKSRKNGLGNFRLTGAIRVNARHIQLPRLGKVRLKEGGYLPVDGTDNVKVLSATVSERAGRWFVSLQVEQGIPDPKPAIKPVVGIDLGITTLATASDGMIVPNPRALTRVMRKVKRLQRRASRRELGSANRRKANRRVTQTYARATNIRVDVIHKATTRLAKTKSVIVLEDLHVAGLLRNHALAGAIADASWREFRRQLEYKAKWYGSQVVFADRFYPSSKRCHVCGLVRATLDLATRTWSCDGCGTEHQRDLNAALNLEYWLHSSTASSAGSDVCREERSMSGPHGRQVLLGEAETDDRLASC